MRMLEILSPVLFRASGAAHVDSYELIEITGPGALHTVHEIDNDTKHIASEKSPWTFSSGSLRHIHIPLPPDITDALQPKYSHHISREGHRNTCPRSLAILRRRLGQT